jgi:lipopolysaccharide export system protein LptA
MNRAFAVFACVLLAAATAQAERADREKEVVLLADKGVADDVNKTSTFEGNVIITQGTMRVTAAKVTLREKDNFKYYVATGAPVTFRQKRDKTDEWVEGVAERAEFDDRDDVLKLFNRAKVKSSQNEITGNFISYDMRREVAEVTGAPPGQRAPEGTRVKVIIVPQKTPGAAPKEAQKEAPKGEPPANLKTDKELK